MFWSRTESDTRDGAFGSTDHIFDFGCRRLIELISTQTSNLASVRVLSSLSFEFSEDVALLIDLIPPLRLRRSTTLRIPVAKYTTNNAKMTIKVRKPAMSPKVTQSVSFSSLNMLVFDDDGDVEDMVCYWSFLLISLGVMAVSRPCRFQEMFWKEFSRSLWVQ